MRRFAIFLGAIAGLVILVTLAGLFWMSGSLPMTDGAVTVSGADAPVSVNRDAFGIPHIQAESEADAYFGLGFVHAQDRLWQMETARRAGAGRLSEVFGSVTIDADKYLRTLGLYRAAEASLDAISPHSRSLIDAYSAGVNAFLNSHVGALPPEFIVVGHRPEPWSPADSVVAIKMMSIQLAGNASDELLRYGLLGRLSQTQIDALWTNRQTGETPDSAAYSSDRIPSEAIFGLLDTMPPAPAIGIGSNNWVVNGASTDSGKPILANDPHLGLTAPSSWYLVHLQAPGLDVVGGTLPGIPVIVIGRNLSLAWGVTNTGPDVQDLFIERTDPADSSRYLTPDGSLPFDIRTETIAIKDAPSVSIRVRETRHGPVISDASARYAAAVASDESIALAWTALTRDDTTIQAGFQMVKAESLTEMFKALRDFQAPQQNFVGASVDGSIGFFAPGLVPIRNSGDGWMPSQGWTDDGDWVGMIPYDDLPMIQNPDSGQIVTANQRIVPDDYSHFISRDWATPYRAQRIRALLADKSRHNAEFFISMQSDQVSLMAREMIPLITNAEASGFSAEVRDYLRDWDGDMAAERAEPLIFYAWYRALTQRIYGDELGEQFRSAWRLRPAFMHDALESESAWCDDITTERAENCAVQIGAALDIAVKWLVDRYGEDIESWSWGEAHQAIHQHRMFSGQPVLGALHDIRHPMGGGPFTVSQANIPLTNDANPFSDIHGPGLRIVMDMNDADSTRAIISTGQSGNRFSSHYKDLNRLWADGAAVSLPMTEAAIESMAKNTLVLTPNP